MAISPLEMNGMYTRTQDFTAIKQHEDNRAMIGQTAIQTQAQKEEEQKATQVTQANETETHQQQQDAREKGKNEYMGDGGKNRKKKDEIKGDGIVRRKMPARFDASI